MGERRGSRRYRPQQGPAGLRCAVIRRAITGQAAGGRVACSYTAATALLGLVIGTRWALREGPDFAGCVVAAGCAAALVWWCTVLGATDLREYRLPDRLTLPGGVLIWAAASASGCGRAAVVGSVLLAGLYAVLRAVRPGAMGAGDMKLALGLGAVTASAGGTCWAWAAAGAPALTIVGGLCARVAARRSDAATAAGPSAVPHGASMCLASLLALAAAG